MDRIDFTNADNVNSGMATRRRLTRQSRVIEHVGSGSNAFSQNWEIRHYAVLARSPSSVIHRLQIVYYYRMARSRIVFVFLRVKFHSSINMSENHDDVVMMTGNFYMQACDKRIFAVFTINCLQR